MSDNSDPLDQDEIEKLLSQTGAGPSDKASSDTGAESTASENSGSGGEAFGIPPAELDQNEIESLLTIPKEEQKKVQPGISTNDVELLLDRAQNAIDSLNSPGTELPPGVKPFHLEDFGGTPANEHQATIELVRDVQLDLKIELGRTKMTLEDVLRLQNETVITLDKLAGDPVDVYVNGRLIACGEVLVLNDNFCVRITELIVGDSAVA